MANTHDTLGSDGNSAAIEDSLAIINVAYRTPWGSRVIAFMARLALSLLVFIFGGALVGGLMAAYQPLQPPTWMIVALPMTSLVLAAVLFVRLARRKPNRLAFRDEAVHTGGWLLGRRIPYGQIALLEMEAPESTLGDQRLLWLHPSRGGRIRIWLRSNEAIECFDAMRGLCPHAPAIDVGGETLMPLDPACDGAGIHTLVTELRRKARRYLIGAVCLGALMLFYIVGSLLGTTSTTRRWGAWASSAAFGMAGLGILAASLDLRRRAIELERKLDDQPSE